MTLGRLTRPLLGAALFGAALLCGACGRGKGPILIGAAAPITELNGRLNRMGIDLAVEQINARGGIGGRPLAVVHRDDRANGEQAAEIAQEFLDSAGIVAVVGHMNSGAMMAAAKIYDLGLPAVATSATSPNLTGISRWVFRVVPSDALNAAAMAHFAASIGAERVGILYENDAYGRGLASSFRRSFPGQVIGIDPVHHGESAFEPFVTSLRREAPDLVFVASTDQAGRAFLQEARRQKLPAVILGGDGWAALAGDTALAEGVYVGAAFTAEDRRPLAQKFVQAFEKKYHVVPDAHAALAYDATMIVAQAIREVGPDREKIRAYLASLRPSAPYIGVTGRTAFGRDGDPVGKEIAVTRVHDGAMAPVAERAR